MATQTHSCDVLIAGGGLAGQTLARQLKLTLPQLDVQIVEPQPRPLPAAAHKVGEATSELGAHYLAEKLQLRSHLEQDQILKCGLRFFFGNGRQPLETRPEYGPKMFPPISSYQLDRGVLENHLRGLNQAAGVRLWEGRKVTRIETGDPHTTFVGDDVAIRSHWVVDCTGRQRLIQRQKRLAAQSPLPHSACWWRVAGNFDIAGLVPADSPWHERVPGGIRRNSTNHFTGHSYWIWVIPLVSGSTSFGIVVDERIHPVSSINTFPKACAWLEQREPLLARHLAKFPLLDFKLLRNFSYHTTQFFSTERWACIGEAAMFLDPFYSPGTDFIALGNTLLTRLIRDGATPESVAQCDAMMLEWQDAFTEVFRDQYPVFGSTKVMTAKVVWDNASYWVFVCQSFFQNILDDPEYLERYRQVFAEYHRLNRRVQQLFRDWAACEDTAADYEYLGYADFPIAVRAHLELGVKKTPRRFLDWLELNLDRFKAWAVVLGQLAGREVTEDAAAAEIAAMQAQMRRLFPAQPAVTPAS